MQQWLRDNRQREYTKKLLKTYLTQPYINWTLGWVLYDVIVDLLEQYTKLWHQILASEINSIILWISRILEDQCSACPRGKSYSIKCHIINPHNGSKDEAKTCQGWSYQQIFGEARIQTMTRFLWKTLNFEGPKHIFFRQKISENESSLI